MLLAHALLTAQRDDGVERRKGHVHSAGLPKCVHYIRHIVENWITRIYHHNRITDAFHKMCLCENTPDKKKRCEEFSQASKVMMRFALRRVRATQKP